MVHRVLEGAAAAAAPKLDMTLFGIPYCGGAAPRPNKLGGAGVGGASGNGISHGILVWD